MCGTLPAVEGVRLDKWLWAARLVKTRGLAVEAIGGGRVHVNGARVKPSKDVRAGDRVEITVGQVRREVIVRGVAERRGPAREAQLLYEETPESIAAREREREARRLAQPPAIERGAGRPTKRDRRRYDRAARSRRRG
jgi:ribosome-associated heat shock protein Hsp15